MSYGLINHISENNNANINITNVQGQFIFSAQRNIVEFLKHRSYVTDVDDDDLLKTLLLGLHTTTSNARKNYERASYGNGYNLSGMCPENRGQA